MRESAVAVWRQSKRRHVLLGVRGKVVTFSVVRTAPSGFEKLAPYVVAIVELADGKRITAQVVDWEGEEIKIGSRVEAVFRRLYEPSPDGVIEYGVKFRLSEVRSEKWETGI